MASITIPATDGTGNFAAYLVAPKTKPAGVVVLIQEIFGVNQAMRDIAAWVADIGFIAVCPDLFWRIEPGIDITDKSDAEWKRAFELFQTFDQAKGIEDLKATVAAARKLPVANGKVGTMGYCLGGRLAFMMAEQSDAEINISYYGVGLDGLLDDLPKVSSRWSSTLPTATNTSPPMAVPRSPRRPRATRTSPATITTPITPSPASAASTGMAEARPSPTAAAPKRWSAPWNSPHPGRDGGTPGASVIIRSTPSQSGRFVALSGVILPVSSGRRAAHQADQPWSRTSCVRQGRQSTAPAEARSNNSHVSRRKPIVYDPNRGQPRMSRRGNNRAKEHTA